MPAVVSLCASSFETANKQIKRLPACGQNAFPLWQNAQDGAQPGIGMPAAEVGESGGEAATDRHSFFRRCRWSRRAQVSSMIDESPIRLMANSGDERDGAPGGCPNDDLLAEAHEIFKRAAAAGDD